MATFLASKFQTCQDISYTKTKSEQLVEMLAVFDLSAQ